MAQQITPKATVAGHDAVIADVHLGALAVELGLGDVTALGEPF
jgi:hypothetical protein